MSSALSKTCDLEFSNGFGRLLLITPFSHLSPVKPSSCSLCIKEVDCFLMSYTCCFTPLPRFRSGHSKNLIFHIFISAPPCLQPQEPKPIWPFTITFIHSTIFKGRPSSSMATCSPLSYVSLSLHSAYYLFCREFEESG